MSLPVAHGLTVADLERMDQGDHLRRELIDGELYVTPAPALRHQSVIVSLVYALETYVRAHGGRVWPAPTGVKLSDVTMVEPDVVVLDRHSAERVGVDDRYVTFPPDLVVEVSSPSTRRLDLIKKRALYERVGVAEYWFVDLDADVVDVYRLADDGHFPEPVTLGPDQHLVCAVLPGFEIPVTEILARDG